MKFRAWILCCAVLIPSCAAPRLADMTPEQRAERLATERGRILELTDPVDRTESYITISHILLSFAVEAAREGDTADMRALIAQYVETIQSARDTMADSGRDATRDPEGYMDLEIAMREQLRILEDLSVASPLGEREPLEGAIEVATDIRNEMLRLMFPQGVAASISRQARS